MTSAGLVPADEQRSFLDGKSLLIMGVLLALGIAGNYFKFTLFFNADLIFGSIFTMLALQLFGVGVGTAAALIISFPLLVLWGHPYAIVIMTAEVAGVGWLNRRLGIGLVKADVLYWLAVGMPLVYVTYHLVMGIPHGSTLFIMVKDMVNGLTNVLLARMAFYVLCSLSRRSPIGYREAIYNMMAFFVLGTALVLMAVESRQDFRSTDQRIQATLLQDSKRTTHALELWGERRRTAMTALADLAARSPRQVQAFVEQTQAADTSYLRVGLVDRDGLAYAFSPQVDALGHPNIGKDLSTTPFIPALRRTLKPMLSEAFLAQIGRPTPVVTMVAPILIHGAYAGYVTGVLDTDHIQELLAQEPSSPGTRYTLLDKNGKTIMTNRTDQKVMEPLTRGRGTLKRLEAGISQWLPELPPNTPATERWAQSSYVAEAKVGALAEWTLILEQPMAPFQKALFDRYARILMVVFLLVILALAVAEIVSRRMTQSLEALEVLTLDLPAKLASQGPDLQWPDSGLLEASHLIANFRQMATSLVDQFHEIREAKATLEQRVATRTHELRSSEESLRQERTLKEAIVDSTDDVIITKTLSGIVTSWNRGAESLLGYTETEMLGRSIRIIIPADRLDEEEEVVNLMRSGKPIKHFETVRCAKDGRLIPVSLAVSPLHDSQGRIIGATKIARDITELKATEKENASLQAQVQQSQKLESLGTLSGGIAHDMNNVLGAILSLASGHLTLQPKGTPLYEALATIAEAAVRGGNMVKGLLAFARQQPAEERELDLNAVLDQDLKLLERTTLAKVRFETELAPELQPVMGDPGALGTALMNLCLNAIDAMPDQGVLRLRTRNLDPDRIEIEIEDTGHGMTPEVLAKALDPFFTTKETGKGTGLGLSMAYSTVKAHHGQMQIRSAPGKGTCVSIQLPACRRTAQMADAPVDGLAKGASRVFKVMLVDDDELIQKSIGMLIEILGHAVVITSTGEAALAELQRFTPDLVILDMNMPGLGGAGTLPQLRIHLPAVPVLLATGRADQEALALIARHPNVSLLSKPFGLEELQEQFERLGRG